MGKKQSQRLGSRFRRSFWQSLYTKLSLVPTMANSILSASGVSLFAQSLSPMNKPPKEQAEEMAAKISYDIHNELQTVIDIGLKRIMFEEIINAGANKIFPTLQKLIEERDEAREHLKAANKNHEKFERQWYLECDKSESLQSRLTAANEQIEKLKEWLPYIEHKAYCETGQGPGRECSCGLTAYRESIKGGNQYDGPPVEDLFWDCARCGCSNQHYRENCVECGSTKGGGE